MVKEEFWYELSFRHIHLMLGLDSCKSSRKSGAFLARNNVTGLNERYSFTSHGLTINITYDFPEMKLPLERQDNIKMDLKETGWEGVDWTVQAHDRNLWRAFSVMG